MHFGVDNAYSNAFGLEESICTNNGSILVLLLMEPALSHVTYVIYYMGG